MGRKPSPWYRVERNEWCVTIAGEHRRLGGHPADAPAPKQSRRTGKWNAPKSIEDAFFKLMGGRPIENTKGDTVIAILDDFITWCKENRELITALRYERFCQDFVKTTDERGRKLGSLVVQELSARQVTCWLGTKTWGPTNKRNAITALQRGFNWAVNNRGLLRNPIRGMEKPEGKARARMVTPDEFEKLLGSISDDRFRNLLVVSYDSGGRPFEIRRLEARHCQTDMHRAVIPKEEAKGRRQPRIIYFPTDRSMEIVRRLCEHYPAGPLFRNSLGNAWTAEAVKCRFEDLEIAFGREEMERRGLQFDLSEERITELVRTLSPIRKNRKTGSETAKKRWELRKEARNKLIAAQARRYGKRFMHYAFRHSFITRKLVAGVDSHVVAKLAGHSDTRMLDTTYSHIADDYEFMLKQAQRDIQSQC